MEEKNIKEKENILSNSGEHVLEIFQTFEESYTHLDNKIKEHIQAELINSLKKLQEDIVSNIIIEKLRNAKSMEESSNYLDQYLKHAASNYKGKNRISKKHLQELYEIKRLVNSINELKLGESVSKIAFELKEKQSSIDSKIDNVHELISRISEREYFKIEGKHNSKPYNERIKIILGVIFSILIFGPSLYILLEFSAFISGVVMAGIGITAFNDYLKIIFKNKHHNSSKRELNKPEKKLLNKTIIYITFLLTTLVLIGLYIMSDTSDTMLKTTTLFSGTVSGIFFIYFSFLIYSKKD